MVFPVAVTLVTTFFYALVMFLLLLGLSRLKRSSREKPDHPEQVTVVVPFRNEAAGLPGLIEDLFQQTYPADMFSVVLVNDHSTDGSGDQVASLVESRPGFSCLDLPDGKGGKKAALGYAISNVHTGWIIQMDADCRIAPGFINAHMTYVEEYPSELVAGFVTTRNGGNRFMEAFERLDLLGLAGAGAGSFHFGRPLMCSGANLLYSRQLFLDTRKFDPVKKTASGDDMFLLIGARKLKRRTAFNPELTAMVQTHVVSGPGKLIRQRMRWGAKSAYYRMADLQGVAVLVALTNLMLLLAPVWMILFPGSISWFLPALGIKALMDFLILHATTGATGQRRSLWWFLPVSVVYYLYIPVVISGSLFRRSTWKERED